jgi:hypothetical protein
MAGATNLPAMFANIELTDELTESNRRIER